MGSINFLNKAYEMNISSQFLIKDDISKRSLDLEISLITEEIVEKNREEINKAKSGAVRSTILESKISQLVDSRQISYQNLTREDIIKLIVDRIFGYSILQKYIEDPEVNDIMVIKLREDTVKKASVPRDSS